MSDFQAVVVGAGVVGLATARLLALEGKTVLMLERHALIGSETSSRNSEVIHAGIYYPQGSLKARLCVQGRRLLYAFAERARVPHRRCGKLVLAVEPTELETLERLQVRATDNGVERLELLDKRQLAARAPGVRAEAALHSPETGIIDSHAFMSHLLHEAEQEGATLALHAPVERVSCTARGFNIVVGGIHQTTVTCDQLIIAAGLGTPAITFDVDGTGRPSLTLPLCYAKGHYFKPTKRIPINQLLYPVPVPGGLGTHATVTIDGAVRFGPDVKWIDEIDYRFENEALPFYDAVRRWYPAIDNYELVPDYTGIRPKLVGRGEPDADFRIDGEDCHGISGLVLAQGIESPGLTCSLAIAHHITALLK